MKDKNRVYKIFHRYDQGDRAVYVQGTTETDVIAAAVYCQFLCEEHYGPENGLGNLGIAAALVTFYGCRHAAVTRTAVEVDMYYERERRCGSICAKMMEDEALARKGLREYLKPYID